MKPEMQKRLQRHKHQEFNAKGANVMASPPAFAARWRTVASAWQGVEDVRCAVRECMQVCRICHAIWKGVWARPALSGYVTLRY